LTHEEGIKLLDDLRAFNVPAVLFSGGEPLAREDTPELIRYARSIGLQCTLSTNGLLIDDKMAGLLSEVGLKYAGISVDGVPERHDKLRGMKGAFNKTLEAIDRCRRHNIRVGMRFTVHALNKEDLDPIIDLCVEHDVQRLCVYHLAYSGRGGKMQKVDLTAQETREVVDTIFERTRALQARGVDLEVLTVDNHADAAYTLLALEKTDPARAAVVHERLAGTGGNRSGCNIAAVDPMGNVHYDQFSWHYDCGNVRTAPFSQIWGDATDPRLAILRDRRSHLPARCQACRFVDVCNGNLRTRAEAATGDWLGMDPSCYLTDEEIAPRA
jgi:radical SAM protein with 4Fe4S-binding SPASM domain